MRLILLGIFLSGLIVRPVASQNLELRTGCTAIFSSPAQAAKILGEKDDFVQRLSPFDRAARMKTDKAVSPEQFLAFVKASAAGWTEAEQARLTVSINALRPALERLAVTFPKTVTFIKTTGAEEGHAFYTRDTAIIMPEKETNSADDELLKKTIAHELFHILSRNNPGLRETLYQVIGFTKCDEIGFPEDLKSRKITNPDAPRNDHAIRVRVNDRELDLVPILFSKTPNYDPAKGGEFFNYLELAFLPLPNASSPAVNPLAPQQLSGFFEQVGRNTDYIIHPEEILAENFALLLMDKRGVPSPEILEKMRAVVGPK